MTDYFRSWDVALSFVEGEVMPDDPTDDPAQIEQLCDRFRPVPGAVHAPAVLVLAEVSTEGFDVNGILLDPKSRGACAIFTRSSVFQRNRSDDRFEVFAHEIGHLLNLIHADANEAFPTAMNQWDQRSAVDDRRGVWNRVVELSSLARRQAIGAYLGDASRRPLGLPMSRSCDRWLTGPQPQVVAPWGSQFRDADADAGMDLDVPAQCELTIDDRDISVGETLDCRVTLQADGGDLRKPVAVPVGFGLRDGSIALYIDGPDGSRRTYASKVVVCSSGTRLLSPGETVRRSYSLLADRRGLLFPDAGSYTIQAGIPKLGLRSNAVRISVAEAKSLFVAPQFREFLARGMPSSDEAGWRAVATVIDDQGVKSAVRAHLANEQMAKRPRGSAAGTAELIESSQIASPRTYQKNVLLRLARLRKDRPADDSEAKRLLEQAERLLRDDDTEHPSLGYLAHVRTEFQRRRSR